MFGIWLAFFLLQEYNREKSGIKLFPGVIGYETGTHKSRR